MGDKAPSSGASGVEGRIKTTSRTYQELSDVPEAEAFLAEKFKQSDSRMSQEQREALDSYALNGFEEINMSLREPEVWTDPAYWEERFGTPEGKQRRRDRVEAQVVALNSAPGIPLGKDTMLYRGISIDEIGDSDPSKFTRFIRDGVANGTLVGSQFTDKGFGSTSVTKNMFSYRDVLLQIRAPKETNVLIPNPKGENGAEREVLLRPNVKYTIKGYTERTSITGITTLILDVDMEYS